MVRVIDCNLRLAGLDATMALPTLVQTQLTLLESLRFWTRPRTDNLRAITEVVGLEHLETGERAGPVVIVAPHYGNWELLVQWLAARLYQGQTTNFRTPGGGFAPVYSGGVHAGLHAPALQPEG